VKALEGPPAAQQTACEKRPASSSRAAAKTTSTKIVTPSREKAALFSRCPAESRNELMTDLTRRRHDARDPNDESPTAARMAVWSDELEQHQHSRHRSRSAPTRVNDIYAAQSFHIAPRRESVHGGSNTRCRGSCTDCSMAGTERRREQPEMTAATHASRRPGSARSSSSGSDRVHIEQGRWLNQADVSVGIPTCCSCARRHSIAPSPSTASC
jgi:hypothetical protein